MGLWGIGGTNSASADDSDNMSEGDKMQRAGEQARASIFGSRWEDSSPDEDGHATGGCRSDDYPDNWHEQCNKRLDDDEYYEAEADKSVRTLFNWFNR
ncbi:MAG: hypothetical protein AAFY54_01885 [Cyanobacteria bacterium J06648_10]